MAGYRSLISLAGLGLAISTVSCTLEPAFMRPAAPVAPAYPTAGAASGPRADEIAWQNFFVDPRLKRLIAIALENNRDLRVSILNIEAAEAQYRIARAALFPTLDGVATGSRGADAGRSVLSASYDDRQHGRDLRQHLMGNRSLRQEPQPQPCGDR